MFEHATGHKVLVPFSGPGAGTAPLAWGQKVIMTDMRAGSWSLNASGAHALPKGFTVDDVAAQLSAIVSKYSALRTRIDVDEQGEPCQVAYESGEIALDVIDVDGDADPAAFTDRLWYDWLFLPFDHRNDWLMRMAVIRHRGVALYRALTFDHLIVDGMSIALLKAELGVDEVEPPTGDPRTVSLLELGRREQTPEGRRISDRAMRYWESQLRSIPPLTFGEPTHPEGRQGKRFWHGRSNSKAAYLAMLAIAKRTRTDTARVLLAIIMIAAGRVTGVNPLPAKVIVNNRFRPGFAEAIGPLSQNSLVKVDMAGATIDEVVARSRQASLLAGMNGYYDPAQLDALTARLDAERGYPAQVTWRINDRRVTTKHAVEEAVRTRTVTAAEIEAAKSESFVVWDGTLERFPEQAIITVDDYVETVALQVIFDMACFTEAEVEALLNGVEEVAVEAAFNPAAPARVAMSYI